jgi:methyl-accepting chemotaxis protein
VQLSQATAAVDQLAAAMQQEVGLAGDRLEAAAQGAADPGVTGTLDRARRELADYAASIGDQARFRRELIVQRDTGLFPRIGEYDQAFEAVSSMIEIDVPEAQREEARQRLMTFHQAVGDVRLGSQRYLATGDEVQARRVRRAAAQLRVHARALAGVAASGPGAADLRRITDIAEGTAKAALEVVRLAEAMQKARAEHSTPARERLEAALAEANERLGVLAGARIAASAAATDRVGSAVLWIGLAVALILVASGWLTARAIGAPLRRLARTIRTIAAGDAGTVVPDRDRQDEIGAIAGALEALRGTVQRAFAQQQMLEQMSNGIMTADPHRPAAADRTRAAGQGGGAGRPEHRRAARPAGTPARPAGRSLAPAAPEPHPDRQRGARPQRVCHP